MFEKAARMKLRFQLVNGRLSVEDLFDLKESDLDSLYQELSEARRKMSQASLMVQADKNTEMLDLKIEIVKHVFGVIKAEREAKILAIKNAQTAKQIKEVIAKKQAAGLEQMSIEDLNKMLDDVNG